jgi:hypothetical protein
LKFDADPQDFILEKISKFFGEDLFYKIESHLADKRPIFQYHYAINGDVHLKLSNSVKLIVIKLKQTRTGVICFDNLMNINIEKDVKLSQSRVSFRPLPRYYIADNFHYYNLFYLIFIARFHMYY